jgi:hypothetical protein
LNYAAIKIEGWLRVVASWVITNDTASVAEIVRTETGLERAYLPLDEINANVTKIKAADCLLYHCSRALLAIFNYKCSPQVLEVPQQHDIGGTLASLCRASRLQSNLASTATRVFDLRI